MRKTLTVKIFKITNRLHHMITTSMMVAKLTIIIEVNKITEKQAKIMRILTRIAKDLHLILLKNKMIGELQEIALKMVFHNNILKKCL